MNLIFSLSAILIDSFFTIKYNLPLILIGILGLCLLVVFHELGHFIFCKIFNVYTPSFSIGLGPRLFQKKIGDTVFAISAIPLGGYVEIAGAQEVGQGEQAHANSKDSRSFNQKSYWQKLLILSGGILFNFIFTYLTLSLLFYIGAPCIGTICQKYPTLISMVVKDSTADKAGLKINDKVIAVNNVKIKNVKHLNKLLIPYIDKTVNLKIERNKKEETLEIKVASQKIGDKEKPELSGILWQVTPLDIKNALIAALNSTFILTKDMFNSLKNIFKNKDQLGGPLLIIAQLKSSITMGWKFFILMLSFISLNLAIINLIPLPIFDGGQILFYTIEAITGKPLSEQIREYIHYLTWILVISLTLYITYKDIIKISNKLFKQKTELPTLNQK